METKSTDKEILIKGLKQLGLSLLLMFIGPSFLLNNDFIKFTDYIGYTNLDWWWPPDWNIEIKDIDYIIPDKVDKESNIKINAANAVFRSSFSV